MNITHFIKISNYLTHPLVLVGFTLFLLFGLFQFVIKAGLIPKLTQTQGANALSNIIRYGFIISIIVVFLGFGLHFYNSKVAITRNEINKATSALDSVLFEIGRNVINLSTLINSIESAEFGNYTKTHPRRVNETELAHRDRIRNLYRDYEMHIDQYFDLFNIKNDSFHAHRNTLVSLSSNGLQNIDRFYDNAEKSYESALSYKNDVAHCISLDYSDAETTSYLTSHLIVKTSTAKSFLCEAYSYLCLLADTYPQVINTYIPISYDDVPLTPGKLGSSLFRQKSAYHLGEKAKEHTKISIRLSGAKVREVERRVTDPFILYIRKLNGLGEQLSEAQIWSLEKKELSTETDDPKKLMSLASSSYMEGDGQYTKIYLERVKACKGIGPKTLRYLDASIKRLENPDMFGESLGIMVMEIEPGGLFQEAGIIEGDIIYKLNEKPLHEPEEISRALGWDSDYSFLLTIRRDEKTITKPITPGKSAGALTWALVTFYQSRL